MVAGEDMTMLVVDGGIECGCTCLNFPIDPIHIDLVEGRESGYEVFHFFDETGYPCDDPSSVYMEVA